MKKSENLDIKKILKEQREEFQSYLGAAMEHFDEKVAIIAEAVTSLTDAIKKMQRQIADLQEMVAQNTMDIAMIKEDIKDMKADISLIRGDLKQKADREELLLIERRVTRLEHAVRP